MRAIFVCPAVWGLFFAFPTGALIIQTPTFLRLGPARLNFTKEVNDPIGAFFNIAVPANASRLVDNVDLSVGFVDINIEVLPGTYEIFAIGNDTDGGRFLGNTDDFPVIDLPSTPTTTSSSSSSSTTSSTVSSTSSSTATSAASSTATSATSLTLSSNPSSTPSSASSSAPTSSTSGTAVVGQSTGPSNSAIASPPGKSKPSTAIIVGVVISVLVLLAVLILLFLFLRRRKQRARRRDSRGTLEAPAPMVQSSYPSAQIDPFITPPSSSTSLSSPQQRQQYITNEMRLVRKQMEELRRTGNGTRFSSSVPESSIVSPTTPGSSSNDTSAQDLERSRQQNDALQSRIVQLEAQLQSAWALGLSNDPPPGYVA